MLNKCSACTMPRCVSVCMYVVCIMSASIHTCRCALSYEWTVFYSTYCSYVCLRCIWIWMTSHCTVSDCQSSWCETTRPQRSLLNSVLTHTHSHSQTLIYINKLNVHSMPSDCTRSCIWMRTHMCMDGYWYAHTHRTMWGVAWTGIGYPGNHIIGGQAWLGLWSCIGIGVGHDYIDLRHQSAVLSRIPYIV